MGEEYSHPDHGEMEWVEYDTMRNRDIEGWRCEDCHVIGPPDRVDEVFDNHECGHYEEVRKGISGKLP